MLGKRAYLLLWREILALQKTGTTVVFTAEAYEDIVVPCDRYIFFRGDGTYKKYGRKELPRPAKVITIEGGNVIIALAIAARNKDGLLREPITPCGSCRQVILEIEQRYGQPVKLYLYGTSGVYVINSVKDILPLSFVDDGKL